MTRPHALCWIALAVLTCAACDGGNRPAAPSSPQEPASPPQVASSTITVHLEGRVLDADQEKPIPGAIVETVEMCHPGACGPVREPARTRANENGLFVLGARLPQDWEEVLLSVTSETAYEPARLYVGRRSAADAVLRMYRAVTIRAGESIQLRVLNFHAVCGFESIPCRRTVVDSSAGHSVTLEVTPADPQDEVGLQVGEPPIPFTTFQRRLAVRGGDEVWILRSAGSSGPGRVALAAHGR